MVDVRLRPSAEKDFVEIGEYTREEWPEAQARIYLQKLLSVIRQIGDKPLAGRTLSGIRAGYRCRRSGSHLIYYIAKPELVEVVRILHEKVDVRRHLDDKE
ncbi:type II toxin-antitoxin system RelE/ParE family toxin [Rhizobium sp. NFR07]|uniref:type II toxin-antitoxin system RelE/ParE family toxin n=1 Tax=Rhizobium sp. NFR07 TaxID=1566262 RepID=UPI000B80FF2F|nr:type II toxin-antitoxin system RelE/ParE family toxin [Rhizobium sp. NFR07]